MTEIQVDMNNPEFQESFFSLEKEEQLQLIKTLKKVRRLSWLQLYSDQGLKWEAILSKKTKTDERIYSFRFSQKYRGSAIRVGNFLRLLSIHVDHDSAYK
jgi:hypothetical protein